MFNHVKNGVAILGSLGCILFPSFNVSADPHVGQSQDVVIIGGTVLSTTIPCGSIISDPTPANHMGAVGGGAGCLPVSGPGIDGVFDFTPMLPDNVTVASLAPFDTALLNMASLALGCTSDNLSQVAKDALVSFIQTGHKLIIYDSECFFSGAVNYDWLPFPFQTNNTGPEGSQGTLNIVENNLLSTEVDDPSCVNNDTHCIDGAFLSANTDAVGDSNVMTTFDPNWCVDMSATNSNGVTGPVHTYALSINGPSENGGQIIGMIIYNGLDMDHLFRLEPEQRKDLRKIWIQELEQPFYPKLPIGLACATTVVGISLNQLVSENVVNTNHTLTASMRDLVGTPSPGIPVSFTILDGPNAGDTGTCSTGPQCLTDANGQVAFTYLGDDGEGVDSIHACFSNDNNQPICSRVLQKTWTPPPNVPPEAFCSLVQQDGEKRKLPYHIRFRCKYFKNYTPPYKYECPKEEDESFVAYKIEGTDTEDGTAKVFVTDEPKSVVFGPYESGAQVRVNVDPNVPPSSMTTGGPGDETAARITLPTNPFVFAMDSKGDESGLVGCPVPQVETDNKKLPYHKRFRQSHFPK